MGWNYACMPYCLHGMRQIRFHLWDCIILTLRQHHSQHVYVTTWTVTQESVINTNEQWPLILPCSGTTLSMVLCGWLVHVLMNYALSAAQVTPYTSGQLCRELERTGRCLLSISPTINFSIYPSVYPSIHLSIHPPTHPSIQLSIHPSIHSPSIHSPTIQPTAHSPTQLSIHLSTHHPSTHPLTHPSTHPPNYPSIYPLTIYPSTHASIHPSTHPLICRERLTLTRKLNTLNKTADIVQRVGVH
jgi:hypothetical protein